MEFRFCPVCGASVTYLQPAGDERERAVCSACQTVHYQNPNLVVGSVAIWQDRVLLCRRAIPPRIGFWTLPAGYLELQETTEEGARREAWEEAQAQVQIRQLLAVYDLPHISQVQIIYLADLLDPDVFPGVESQEVGLFGWNEIPWPDLAFPTVACALRHARRMLLQEALIPERRSRALEFDQLL